MNIFIRTDASIQIGSGHVMRCLTLAKQLQKNNVVVKFVCRRIEGNMIDYIINQGFDVFTLKEVNAISHWDWTKEHWLEDAKETISAIQLEQGIVDMLIVDHYSIDIEWEQKLRPFIKKVMVIDDVADRKHDCDLLLDQNYYLNMEHRYKNLVSKDCIQLLGPNNVLLREEFLEIDPSNIKKSVGIKNILVFFGSVDATGETLKTLYALENLEIKSIVINVVIGHKNPFKSQIKDFCERYDNFFLHCQISYMAELMSDADLAIGAGGAASWERMYLKLPAIVIIVANNQKELTDLLAERKMIFLLGIHTEVNDLQIKFKLLELFNELEMIQATVNKFTEIIDYQKIRELPVLNKVLECI